MLVSILLNTFNRFDLLQRCIPPTLACAGHRFELLVCDQGSDDTRVVELIRTLPLDYAPFQKTYHRINATNEGCAQMHNQMLLRANGDLFCLLDDDIEIRRQGWLKDLVDTYLKVSEINRPGMSGIHSTQLCPEMHAPAVVNGIVIHPAVPPKEDAVFGTRMFGRKVLEAVGYFDENFGLYAYVDNQYNSRVHHSGFINYYISGPSGVHHGWDCGMDTPYRKMKDEHLVKYGPLLVADMHRRMHEKDFYVPAPEMR